MAPRYHKPIPKSTIFPADDLNWKGPVVGCVIASLSIVIFAAIVLGWLLSR